MGSSSNGAAFEFSGERKASVMGGPDDLQIGLRRAPYRMYRHVCARSQAVWQAYGLPPPAERHGTSCFLLVPGPMTAVTADDRRT
ncbi:hypothetical protein VTN00DRAFT_4205 [Thermoascus crustaceus]|uniref:uncharacterized protein n=1 Tax=Thermoascus crustaceus TaxID=5088 RepID=UPI003743706D